MKIQNYQVSGINLTLFLFFQIFRRLAKCPEPKIQDQNYWQTYELESNFINWVDVQKKHPTNKGTYAYLLLDM